MKTVIAIHVSFGYGAGWEGIVVVDVNIGYSLKRALSYKTSRRKTSSRWNYYASLPFCVSNETPVRRSLGTAERFYPTVPYRRNRRKLLKLYPWRNNSWRVAAVWRTAVYFPRRKLYAVRTPPLCFGTFENVARYDRFYNNVFRRETFPFDVAPVRPYVVFNSLFSHSRSCSC